MLAHDAPSFVVCDDVDGGRGRRHRTNGAAAADVDLVVAMVENEPIAMR